MKPALIVLVALLAPMALASKPPKRVTQAPHWLQKRLRPFVKRTIVALRIP